MYSPNGFALTLFVSICSSSFDVVATVCPFLMRESMEKGGTWMLARQVRVAPWSLVAARLSASKLNVKPNKMDIECVKSHYLYIICLPL